MLPQVAHCELARHRALRSGSVASQCPEGRAGRRQAPPSPSTLPAGRSHGRSTPYVVLSRTVFQCDARGLRVPSCKLHRCPSTTASCPSSAQCYGHGHGGEYATAVAIAIANADATAIANTDAAAFAAIAINHSSSPPSRRARADTCWNATCVAPLSSRAPSVADVG